jgi:hypothetical protein
LWPQCRSRLGSTTRAEIESAWPRFGDYLGIASCAQYIRCNYKEAMRFAREAIRHRADYVTAHRALTAAAGMAGEDDAAKAALLELRRVQPDVSLEWIAKQIPIEDDSEREQYLEGFRRAGLD